jgi:NitT/TauT family transport system substrate-binding protein
MASRPHPALGRRGVVAGLLLALTAAACGPSAAPPAASGGAAAPGGSAPAAPLKARSAYTTISAVVLPWWMAEAGGYFREQGLDVDLVRVDAGATLLAAMRNGEIDVTFSGAPTMIVGYLQGLETMIIGSTSNGFDSIIVARPELQRPEDLRGKTIGVNRLKAISDVAARQGLLRVGLQPDVDVFIRATGGQAETLAAVETGVVDAAAVSPPVVFEARKRGLRDLINVAQMQIPFLNSSIGATRKVLTERPELGDRYLRALAQAVSRIQTDREFTVRVLGEYSKLDDEELLGATVDYFRPSYLLDPYPDAPALQLAIDMEEQPEARSLRPEEVTDYRFAERLRASGFLDTLPRGQ